MHGLQGWSWGLLHRSEGSASFCAPGMHRRAECSRIGKSSKAPISEHGIKVSPPIMGSFTVSCARATTAQNVLKCWVLTRPSRVLSGTQEQGPAAESQSQEQAKGLVVSLSFPACIFFGRG